MQKQTLFTVLLLFFLSVSISRGQILSEEEEKRQTPQTPQLLDISNLSKQEMTREDWEQWKKQKIVELRERVAKGEALEGAVNPESYLVGPGDIFSFNIWGAMEMRIPLVVTPEGKLPIPSVGEIDVNGIPLTDVQKQVLEKAAPFYENSKITLNLESLRFFRVHVVGEVNYPGTYIAQAVSRVSDLLIEAGDLTDRGWSRAIELRHINGKVDTCDIAAFKQTGDLQSVPFVNGGDVVFVPSIDFNRDWVQVEGDIKAGGRYQIQANENLYAFLQRIRALNSSTNLSDIMVMRDESQNKDKKHPPWIFPFQQSSLENKFHLQRGDRVVLPSQYVYVKGAVRNPGAYPYTVNLKAKDYAGMAGGDYQSGTIQGAKVLHVRTGKTEKGPDAIVEPGDVVDLPQNWGNRLRNYLTIISTITSMVLAAKAVGAFD